MVLEINSVSDLNSSTLKPSISIDNRQSVVGETAPSDPHVLATSTPRRKFTKAYKLKILTAYDACSTALERGALLGCVAKIFPNAKRSYIWDVVKPLTHRIVQK